MTTISDLQVNQKISFEVYPSAQLGNVFKNVTYCGEFDAQLAQTLGEAIYPAHANVYPSLPAGVPNDPTQYSWIRIKFDSGEYAVIGSPWIRAGTIVISEGSTATLIFQNIDQRRLDRILLAIKANNETPDSVTFE
jgi:hypothetical protein